MLIRTLKYWWKYKIFKVKHFTHFSPNSFPMILIDVLCDVIDVDDVTHKKYGSMFSSSFFLKLVTLISLMIMPLISDEVSKPFVNCCDFDYQKRDKKHTCNKRVQNQLNDFLQKWETIELNGWFVSRYTNINKSFPILLLNVIVCCKR